LASIDAAAEREALTAASTVVWQHLIEDLAAPESMTWRPQVLG